METALTLPDGRRLAYLERGPASGRRVLSCSGSPGGKLLPPTGPTFFEDHDL